MNGISGIDGAQNAGSAQGLIVLKKSQDLMKQQSNQLLQALPQTPPPPGPPGVGGNIDLQA